MSTLSDALIAKSKCGDECYTKGRGCMVSTDGRCPHLNLPEHIWGIKFSTKSYFLPSTKKPVRKL